MCLSIIRGANNDKNNSYEKLIDAPNYLINN